MKSRFAIGVFSLLAILIVVMIARVGYRVYIAEDYPIFTDEEQIEETKIEEFGVFAEYL